MTLINLLKNFASKFTPWGNHRYLKFLYNYDSECYAKYSCMGCDELKKAETELRILCHTIEKGLSLQFPRPSFGKEKINRISEIVATFSANGTKIDPQLLELTYSTIAAYRQHLKDNDIDDSFIPNNLISNRATLKAGYIEIARNENQSTFSSIAHQRHSIRYFSPTPITADEIYSAVKLAQTAPSACNRQSIHVFACTNIARIKEITAMHGGLKGFENISLVLAITGDLNFYQSEYERNTVFVDGGIFIMNMLYSLDSIDIGSCPIIWGSEPDNDRKLSSLLSIPSNHKIVGLIVAGHLPSKKYRVAASPRRDTDSILHITA